MQGATAELIDPAQKPMAAFFSEALSLLSSLFSIPLGDVPALLPTLVTIRGIRFPSDPSEEPHLLTVTTTTHGVNDGPDACWGHVPDLRPFWKTEQGWQWRDVETFRLENQPIAGCDGLYVLFYSFDLDNLPQNERFPEAIFERNRTFAGDAFVFKIQGREIGEDLGEDGWAAWQDVPEDILSLDVMRLSH
ncbi:hypothetical protein B0T21DRAFT_381588 [Apiosordaria backusii]|uniref:DUF1963 domain-containing protein n=1 Tax=Apiosordaria backusii TaxID=314023 RepID=A0AA40K0W7_9PEZI|nr:hypothetical protein B0T21DRAFT_381588 [Apiosordaria backusii]